MIEKKEYCAPELKFALVSMNIDIVTASGDDPFYPVIPEPGEGGEGDFWG